VRNVWLGVVVAGAALIAPASAVAHHGAATFDTGKEITLKGVVTEWIWANPHCFLKFDAKDDTGTVRNWAVETQNPVTMQSRGFARRSFKPGEAVTVRLEPVKNGAPVGRMLTVLLPNSQTLVAASPTPPAAP
jgi:hypothetical protein